MFKPLCSTFLILMVFISSPSFADDHSADAPCPEFNNNQYMKWIDLDASCVTREDFIKNIHKAGIWEVTDYEEQSISVFLTKKADASVTAQILFGGMWDKMGASIMTIRKVINCESALHQLETIGFPAFPENYYDVGKTWNIYLPIMIGKTAFMIGAAEPSATCDTIEYLTL